jgi:carbamoyltransferase
MTILGIWDGHDSGAAVVRGDRILYAINEERLTRRKLEVAFPEKSIRACLKDLELRPADIRHIGLSTADFAKTLTRIFPSFKEEYYRIRRRKKPPKGFIRLKKKLKYILTEFGPAAPFRWIGASIVSGRLKKLGFKNFKLHLFDHHLCHAAAAAFSSGFGECVVLTLDGVGDGLSGSVNVFRKGKIVPLSRISSRDSLGIFFEHVTNLLNMRELEDEGKVMALANYACPVEDGKNPMMDFFSVSGLNVKARYPTLKMYDELKKILWKTPFEQFAFMAQRTLEVKILELVRNAVKETGISRIAFSGGVASNVKVNMLIRDLPEIDECFVFPHMGDGGLALGAAFLVNQKLNGVSAVPLDDLFLGPAYTEQEVEETLKKHQLSYRYSEHIERDVARLIAEDKIVLWFSGRMETGPRALGGRSILARADSPAVKDRLNLALKARAWFQPFCPTMLVEDAREFLVDWKGNPDRFMTMGYNVKESMREKIRGVINIDGSCRPQIISEGEHPRFAALLKEVKKITGSGVILNTSFNIHGDPVVCSPQDAVDTLIKTGADALAIENHLVLSESTKTEKRTP